MGTTLNSLDHMLASASTNGLLVRLLTGSVTLTTTSATTTSGYATWQRIPTSFTMPAVGPGLTGAYFPTIIMVNEDVNTMMLCGLEYTLGTITANGGTGTFSAGSTMPTKTIAGTSVQTASMRHFVYISTTLSAVAPVLTITYTDQNGNTGVTMTITIPSGSVVNSMFDLTSSLASGDTGIRAVTDMSWTLNPAAGVARVIGVLTMAIGDNTIGGAGATMKPLSSPLPLFLVEENDVIGMYKCGTNGTTTMLAMLVGVAEN